jgi:hypothetical protein
VFVKLVLPLLLLVATSSFGQTTYSRDISRIFQEKCQQCHREGDIGPFALNSYEAAMTWGEDIQSAIAEKRMPPWKPVAGHGEFKNNFGLSDEQRDMILNWYRGGAPEGDPRDLPEPIAETGEYHLGDPDVVLTMPETYTIARRGDIYRCFVVPTDFGVDRFLDAIQVVPGNRQVVHHVILYLDSSGKARQMDGKDGNPGYDCFGGPGDGIPLTLSSMAGGWVPGMRTTRLPEGVGTLIPKGADIIMQVHYYPGGRTNQQDQTKVGMYFAPQEVNKRLVYLPVINTSFRIPAGAESYDVVANFLIPPLFDATAYLVAPHMHLLGRRFKLEKVRFNGTRESLIRIDDWDFNWQGFYKYETPIRLNAFDQLRATCTFDNSEKNPRNPSNPLKVVRWGEGTEDEMCIGFLGVAFDRENLVPFNLPL